MTCGMSPGVRGVMKMPLNAARSTPQIGEHCADRAVYIDRERFIRIDECFLSRSRRMHIKR